MLGFRRRPAPDRLPDVGANRKRWTRPTGRWHSAVRLDIHRRTDPSWSSFDWLAAAPRSARSTTSWSPTRASAATAASSSAWVSTTRWPSGGEQPLRVAIDRVTLLDRRRRAAVAHRDAPGRPGQGHGRPAEHRGLRRARSGPVRRRRRRVWPADAVEVGPHRSMPGASRAGSSVQPFARRPAGAVLVPTLVSAAARAARGSAVQPATALLPPLLRIIEAREHGDDVVAAVRGHRPTATPPKRCAAHASSCRAAASRPPADDEFYWVDLIGLRSSTARARRSATVTGLIDTGAHSVLRVRRPDAGPRPTAAERLIPFVAAYVDAGGPAARRIHVDWGLDY